jgi:hypothetical protein
MRSDRRRAAVPAAAILLGGILAPSAARGDSATCAFDAVTHILSVEVTPSNDSAPSLNVIQGGEIVISDGDGGSDCGSATVTNTDTIALASMSESEPFGPFHVHQVPAFVPGFTNETGSSDEIEFLVDLGAQGGHVDFDFHASTSPAVVAAGGNEINLNAAEVDAIDADVTVTGSKGVIEFFDTEFADVIDAGGGGPGVPAQPFRRRVFIGDYVLDTGADVFVGGSGDDALFGVGGDDHLEGGSGDDHMSGSSGDDVVLGGPGNDVLYGSRGADTMGGDRGEDFVSGGGGGDVLLGNGGADHPVGGPGPDRLFGGAGSDLVEGQSGDDSLNGGPNHDICIGGAGADTFAHSCEVANP